MDFKETDRQTDRQTEMTKLIVDFRNFANAPKADSKIFVKNVGYRAKCLLMTYCALHEGFSAQFSCRFFIFVGNEQLFIYLF